MKFINIGYTLDDLNKTFDRLYRRISALEKKTTVNLPTSAPVNPSGNHIWMDVGSGKLNVWNGSSWDTFTKD